jgi:hypothetical protein
LQPLELKRFYIFVIYFFAGGVFLVSHYTVYTILVLIGILTALLLLIFHSEFEIEEEVEERERE